ncbi:MAG: HNH endonuclease [Patescibacteria group bacterium]|jgi:hypothetical protein
MTDWRKLPRPYRKTGGNKTCPKCGKSFYCQKKSFSKRKYCSHKCYWRDRKDRQMLPPSRKGTILTGEHKIKISEANSGINNYRWNSGRGKHSSGYISVLLPDKTRMLEHRFVMEQFLGRKLTDEEKVHHINGMRDDNRIENLKLYPNNSTHSKIHWPKGSKFGVHMRKAKG